MTATPAPPPATAPDPRSPSAPPAANAVREAFAPDLEVLKAADELAARLAAGNLTKAETPSTIRATFDAAGIDEAGAEAEVERHRKIIEARRRIVEARRARTEISRIDARRQELLAELEGHEKRIHSELTDLRDAQMEPDTLALLEAHARRDLRTRLLPGYILDEIAEVQDRLNALTPDVQKLEGLQKFQPVTIDAGLLDGITTASGRRQERDRVERRNTDGQQEHADLVGRLEARKEEGRRLHARVEELRGTCL